MKFTEILNKLDNLLLRNSEKANPMGVIFTGDLNFPEDIVEWVISDDGLLANRKPGINATKFAFDQLLDSTSRFNLEQLVDKHTRIKRDAQGQVSGGSILDLIFTDMPEMFSDCKIISLQKISDHDLVHLEFSGKSIEHANHTTTTDIPEISTFNFKRTNDAHFAQVLLDINWDAYIGDASMIGSANANFARALVDAATAARVQKHKLGHQQPRSKQVDNLIKKRTPWISK